MLNTIFTLLFFDWLTFSFLFSNLLQNIWRTKNCRLEIKKNCGKIPIPFLRTNTIPQPQPLPFTDTHTHAHTVLDINFDFINKFFFWIKQFFVKIKLQNDTRKMKLFYCIELKIEIKSSTSPNQLGSLFHPNLPVLLIVNNSFMFMSV